MTLLFFDIFIFDVTFDGFNWSVTHSGYFLVVVFFHLQ